MVGLPDDRWGEMVCAAIVVRPDADAPHGRRAARARGVDARRPKQPRVVVQVDALPRTDATGQIRRRRLRDEIVAAVPSAEPTRDYILGSLAAGLDTQPGNRRDRGVSWLNSPW